MFDCVLPSLARNAPARSAPDPPTEIAPPITHKATAAHAGHIAGLPRLRFCALPDALQHVVPPTGHALAMVFLDHAHCLVMEPDHRPAVLFTQPVLHIRCHSVGHE